ncbi:MAG: hypothetical protein JNK33_01785 [Candidatus Doudnabacteria bacterium]|nr:hypothetical protein [Candidatus Doudnabacteria bacterium]
MRNKIIYYAAVAVLVCSVALPFQALAASINQGFDPNKLIDDKVFADIQTFGGAAGIQKFLESKNSVLANTSPEFLARLKEPTISSLKTALDDPQPNLPRLRTAAELIWDASQSSGLNPQVILVTLNKEQGLVDGITASADRLQRALDFALGFACPDSSGCSQNTLFPGFYYQLFGNLDSSGNRYLGAAKSLMKSFNTPGGRGPQGNGKVYKVGDIVPMTNTLGGYDGVPEQQTVMLTNNATAALYRFTPHVFNGNYNFWKFFNAWFKYANGTVMRVGSDVSTYIIQNGSRLLLPQFVAQARAVDTTKAITVSPTELENYPQAGVYGPADNTIVTVAGETQKYVFVDNVKHPVSDFVIQQRKLNPANTLAITASEAQLFTQGDVLTPSDGTVVRGQSKPEVYLVEAGKLKMYSAFTFKQHNVAKKVQLISDGEIATYPKQGFVAPLGGTLVKAPNNAAVYEVGQGTLHPLSAELFKNRKFSVKNVVTLSAEEMGSLPPDGYALPKDRTFFKVAGTNALYYFRDGTKRSISPFVAKQQRITPDFTFGQAESDSWADGIPVPPRDNTIVKGDGDGTVYLVVKGQLRPLTFAAYQARKITPKKISVLPQAEVNAYAKGEVIAK